MSNARSCRTHSFSFPALAAFAAFCVLGCTAAAEFANAQWVPSGALANIPVIPDCSMTGGDIAVARFQPRGIWYCAPVADRLNARYPGAGHFYFVHEFGHHVVGADERQTDCWAARELAQAPNGETILAVAIQHFRDRDDYHPNYGTSRERADRIQACAGIGRPTPDPEQSYRVRLRIWAPTVGPTGATMDVYVDDEYAASIGNLDGAETVELGEFTRGDHTFTLEDLIGYQFDQYGNPTPYVEGLVCRGTFRVTGAKTYALAVRYQGGVVRCAFQ